MKIRRLIHTFYSPTTRAPDGEAVSPWLGGVDLSQFDGRTHGERIAQAAHFINADILSPMATTEVSEVHDNFTSPEMVKRAHKLGLSVKPWTVRSIVCSHCMSTAN